MIPFLFTSVDLRSGQGMVRVVIVTVRPNLDKLALLSF